MIPVVWSATALAQLRAIRAHVTRFNPRAAGELAARLLTAGGSLTHFPHRGRPVPNTALRELLTISPYIIRYEVREDAVHVLRIRHSARHPTNP